MLIARREAAGGDESAYVARAFDSVTCASICGDGAALQASSYQKLLGDGMPIVPRFEIPTPLLLILLLHVSCVKLHDTQWTALTRVPYIPTPQQPEDRMHSANSASHTHHPPASQQAIDAFMPHRTESSCRSRSLHSNEHARPFQTCASSRSLQLI